MYRITFYTIIGMLSLMFIACNEQTGTIADQTLSYTGIEESADALDFLLRENPFIIETTDDALMIPSFIRIVENNGTYYALDRYKKKVVAFDKSGKIRCVINATGSGPLEYISINDIAWDTHGNRLIMLTPNKILYVSENGDIIDSQLLEAYYHFITAVNRHIILANSTYTDMEHAGYSISILNEEGNITEILPTLPEYAPFCMVNGPELTFTNGEVLFTRKFDPDIYTIDQQGNYAKKYHIDWGNYQFTPETDKEYDCIELSRTCRETNRIYAMSEIQAGERFITFNSNLSGIMIASKDEGKVTLYKFIHDYNRTPLPNYIPVENSDGMVFFYLDANYFRQFSQQSKDSTLIDLASEITPDSNPVILPYRVR